MAQVVYNERSWAIDVISEINIFLNTKSWHFKSAGGENTIHSDKKTLFPDVLVFKDSQKNVIVQGWELKMPDTQINDRELIDNAIKKAKILKRDSFLLWNVKSAVLYHRKNNDFEILKAWDDIDINNRKEVKDNEALWKRLLYQILEDLNSYLELGKIAEATIQELISIDEIIDVVLENKTNTAESIKNQSRKEARLNAEINLWWNSAATEYGFKPTDIANRSLTLSMVVLTDWVFKIVFCNILKKHFNEANQINQINESTTIQDAIGIISGISKSCNFWNILRPNLAQKCISKVAWNQIIELNQFLSTINIDAVDIEILHQLLQSSVASAKRKVAGQFSTPVKLADLLTRLTIDDKTKTVIDPCCGTGTIINQAYVLKEEFELNNEEILNTLWASDKHLFPIQLSTLSLARPSNIGKVMNVFTSDLVDLKGGKMLEFRNPSNGSVVLKEFPKVDYVVSNLPFIKSKEIKVLNPNITKINNWINQQTDNTEPLSGKSDLFAYVPFYLHQILNEGGKIGLILSNAWLGTDYGEIFLKHFRSFYTISFVIISGCGKWFHNADVVTTLLIATKRNPSINVDYNHEVSFCTIHEKLELIEDVRLLSDRIFMGASMENLTINNYSLSSINDLESFGIPWSAYFSKLDWINKIEVKLVSSNTFFKFTRGERRGWNAMFYPESGHGIEEEYIKPVLKHLRNTKNLQCAPNKLAFCCSRSIDELNILGHNGAINWIRSFENLSNDNNEPLPLVLAKPNMYWYEMKTDNMADYVANVNYDKSLFVAQFNTRSFIDQRMIGFSIRDEYVSVDKKLWVAVLNSSLSMFFIESFGFGRGLGALDLRATKFNEDFKILNINLLSNHDKNEIIKFFNPIIGRDRFPLERELEQDDRVNFEKILFRAFGIEDYLIPVKESLLHLYRIRFAVKQ